MTAERIVEIPEGVTAEMKGTCLCVSGSKGNLERDMHYPKVGIAIRDNSFVVSTESSRKRIVAMVGTYAAHARNMCTGVAEGYNYKMKVVYSHFPIQLKLSGDKLEIANFLGEKKSRFASVPDGVTVKLGNDEVTISGIDKEAVGMTAARIEHATKVGNRDTRVFQDGVYIIEKA